jgi:MoaA/NifB/PqqE/SkfB family radical SAM enzyme
LLFEGKFFGEYLRVRKEMLMGIEILFAGGGEPTLNGGKGWEVMGKMKEKVEGHEEFCNGLLGI